MTVTETGIVAAIRRKLADESAVDAAQRWSEAEILGALRAGLRLLYAQRPSAFSVTALLVDYDDVTEPESGSDDWPARTVWIEPLANFVAGTLLADDSDRADPDRGMLFLQLWALAMGRG
jgi:hypothetical protein